MAREHVELTIKENKQMTVLKNIDAVSTQATNWTSIEWERVQRAVKKLQVRIAKAVREGRWRLVKSLQWLLTHSYSAKCLAVKRVTTNKGKRTPGVDGILLRKPEQKASMINALKRRGYRPQPLRRIYIPKPNGKLRPLGIPTMLDRCQQALHALALLPVAESTADWSSYGFRPERCTADAIERLFTGLNHPAGAQWVLEGDIKGCFDNISHEWMVNNICMDKRILKLWLKSGYMEGLELFPTDQGTPQGGICSPILANMVLDGIEDLLGKRYGSFKLDGHRKRSTKNSIQFVRYADDFVVIGKSKEILEHEVKPLIEDFLRQRGLELSQEKTKLTHVTEGFDFLGQNIRRYNCGKYKTKLLIKPSDKNVQTFLKKVREIIKSMKTAKQVDLIRRLNPVIRGWANYHRSVVSKRTFTKVDSAIFWALMRWGKRRHARKSVKWIHNKYFQILNGRNHRFCGTERDERTNEISVWKLMLAEYLPIIRHTKIRGDAVPFDPAYNKYFEARLSRKMPNSKTGRQILLALWKRQNGLCPTCTYPITSVTGGNIHYIISSTNGGTKKLSNMQLLHDCCHGRSPPVDVRSYVQPANLHGGEA
jgi:RNA-directed DNA polymerase